MYYFVSDIHLGLGSKEESRRREELLVGWLCEVASDAKAIFLVGDIFDFWFEYKRVVPKGFVRLLATLIELTQRGIEIHFFGGNHDMWTRDYLSLECGVTLHDKYEVFSLADKQVFISHGDDITAHRQGVFVRIMNAIFRSRPLRYLFRWLIHPDTAMWFGSAWSRSNRKEKATAHVFRGEADAMVKFAHKYFANHPEIDYFVFGHNHCAEIYPITEKTECVFLGEWIKNPTFARMSSDGKIELQFLIPNF